METKPLDFMDDSVTSTPLPRATSTVDRRPDLLPETEVIMDDKRDSKTANYEDFLSNGLMQLNKLTQEVKVLLNHSTLSQSLSKLPPPEKPPRNNIAKNKKNENLLSKESIVIASSAANQPFSPVAELPEEEFSRRLTHTLRSDIECDVIGRSVREKALLALGNLGNSNTGIAVESGSPFGSDVFGSAVVGSFDFPPAQPGANISGFSELMNESDLNRDESWCRKKFVDLPVKQMDITVPSNPENVSMLSQYFKDCQNSSLIDVLGPMDPPKAYRSDNRVVEGGKENIEFGSSLKTVDLLTDLTKSSMKESVCGDIPVLKEKNENICKQSYQSKKPTIDKKLSSNGDSFHDDILSSSNDSLFRRLSKYRESVGFHSSRISSDSLSPDIPRLSEIAQVLNEMPVAATPNSLANKVLEVHQNKLAQRVNTSLNDSTLSLNSSFVEKLYDVNIVYGGGAGVEVHPDVPSNTSIWSALNVDEQKLLLLIKKKSPSEVTVMLFPLVKEDMVVKVREIVYQSNLEINIHKIRITVETPKIEICGINEFDFGCVPEGCSVRIPFSVKILNSNMVICTSHITKDEDLFHVEFADQNEAKEIDMYPEIPVQGILTLTTKSGFCTDPSKSKKVVSSCKLCLNHLLNFLPIHEIFIRAEIFKCSLQIYMDNFIPPIEEGESKKAVIKNESPCPVTLQISTTGSYNVSKSKLSIPSYKAVDLGVCHCSSGPESPLKKHELIMKTVPGDVPFIVILQDKAVLDAHNGLNSKGEEKSLQLECTLNFLSWSSVRLNSAIIKSTKIRNKGEEVEVLLIVLTDPTGSFQLVTKDGLRQKKTVINLNPASKLDICVEFCPKRLGQIKGEIMIRRLSSPSYKKQLHLYGFGGYGHLRVEDVAVDLQNKSMKIPLSPQTLQNTFVLKNIGDSSAFFYINQKKLEGMLIEVIPDKGILEAGEKRKVTLKLTIDQRGTNSYIRSLLMKDQSMDVHLSLLNVTSGDEGCRLRLARLYGKNKSRPELMKAPQVTASLTALCDLFPTNKANKAMISNLKDSLTSMWSLFEDGIHDWLIQVVISREVLKSVDLDTTQEFVSFSEPSMFEETDGSVCDNI